MNIHNIVKGKESKMKKLVLVCTVFLMAVSTSFAFDPMGPATNPWQEGQWGVGFDYSYSDMQINVNGSRYFNHYGISSKLPRKLLIHKYYGTVGYGLTKNIGIFGRAGAASATTDLHVGGAPFAHRELNFGTAPAYGFGVKANLYKKNKLQIGTTAQFSWINDLSARRHIYDFQHATANIDLMEAQIAVAPTYQLYSRVMIYGGPFFHFVRGKFSGKGICDYCGVTDKHSHTIMEKSWFGGYLGMQINFIKRSLLTFEYLHTAAGDGLGGSILIPF